ncbi:MAG: enoyl-CoA hydratase-related protein [Thermoplasmatota archaeon]
MAFKNIRFEREPGGAVALLTIDRPTALNALNAETLGEIETAMRDLVNDTDLRVLIVTGAGEKSFVAGADIRELEGLGPLAAEAHARRGQSVIGLFASASFVTIAAVNGYALGGGLELALACDLIVASENAVFGLPEVSLGVLPGFGGTQRLARAVGERRAKELIFTGRKIPAQEAERIGLATRVVSREKLLAETRSLALEICANAPLGVRFSKEAIARGVSLDLDAGLLVEEKLFGLAFATADKSEGLKAFLEKRKPKFEGK